MLLAATLFLLILQFTLPKRYAFLPLLIAALHLGNRELFADLTPARLIILVGLLRAAIRNHLNWRPVHVLDAAFIGFGLILVITSFAARLDVPSPFIQNAGIIFQVIGAYVYGKSYFGAQEGLEFYARWISLLLIPLAFLLLAENLTKRNFYSDLGAIHEVAMQRLDRTRAQGPFKHPILAGTVGATSLSLACMVWRRRKLLAISGIVSCVVITVASSSSGPLAAFGTSVVALLLFHFRSKVRPIWVCCVIVLIGLHLLSTRGVWYLMANMDLAGGSTGYHRAKLIDNAFDDFGRWWLMGTDYTRGWMFSGVSWSVRHTDITNYYIHLGVVGGAGLMFALIIILLLSFRAIGRQQPPGGVHSFQVWCLGVSILAHAVSFVSVSYFDQIYVLFYFLIAHVAVITAPSQEMSGAELCEAPFTSPGNGI